MEPTRKDWLLTAIHFAGERGLTPVQLQKSMFLLGKECAKEVGQPFYHFTPYNYGPFDSLVYSDAEAMQRESLVEIDRDGSRWATYRVTARGRARSEEVLGNLPSTAREYVRKVVGWIQRLTFAQLVRAIYAQYPEYRANSVFQG